MTRVTILLTALSFFGCLMPMMNRGASTLKDKKVSGVGASMSVMRTEEIHFIQAEYFQRHAATSRLELGYQLGIGTFFCGGQLYGKYQFMEAPLPFAVDIATGIYNSGQDPSALESKAHNNPLIHLISLTCLIDFRKTTFGLKIQSNNWIDGKKKYLWQGILISHNFGQYIQISPELVLFAPIIGEKDIGFLAGLALSWGRKKNKLDIYFD